MRVKFNPTTVTEALEMDCTLWKNLTDNSFGVYIYFREYGIDNCEAAGELDVSDCKTVEEAEKKAERLIDKVFHTGVLDISTEEKQKANGIILY